jgi:ATPase subunit of ABC transporter with duplicated ATPase domains
MIISVRDISFSYPDMKESIFEKVSFSIYSGERIGLLGYNGSGKTTLLDIIKGLKLEENGEIKRKKEGIFYLKQEDYAVGELSVFDYLLSGRKELYDFYKRIIDIEHKGIEDPIEYAKLISDFETSGGYDFINNIKKIVNKFGFRDEDLKRSIKTLSGGERRLLKLATGFLDKSDLFLLDEPTNYLDDEGIEFLTDAIKSSNSAFLIVSHDRWFLDKTVDKIIEIEREKVREYIGNYTKFYNTKQNELKEKLRKKKKIESEIKHLKGVEQSYKAWSNRKEKGKIGSYDKGFIGHRAAKMMKRSIQAKEGVQKKIDELKETKPYIEK